MAVRRAAAKAAPAKKTTRRAAPAKPAVPELKAITEYHKALARYIVTVLGYDPETASSLRTAFLKGVAYAIAHRPDFSSSEFADEWYAKTGQNRRGPKRATEVEEEPAKPAARRGRPAKAQPEPEPEEIEDDEDFDEEDDADEDADDFDEDDDSDEESDDEDFDEDEDDDPEPEPEPVKRRPGRPRKTAAPAATPAKRAPAKAATPAARRTSSKAKAEEEFAF